MDPDTSKKVNDLLSLMEDISTDVDTQTELERLLGRIQSLEEKLSNITDRFEQFEKTYLERQRQIKAAADDVKSLFQHEK